MNRKEEKEFKEIVDKNLLLFFEKFVNKHKFYNYDKRSYVILTEELYKIFDENELYPYEDLLILKKDAMGEYIYVTFYGDSIVDNWDEIVKKIKENGEPEYNNGLKIEWLSSLNGLFDTISTEFTNGESLQDWSLSDLVLMKSMLEILNKSKE